MKMMTLSLNDFNSDRVVLKKSGILLCFSHAL